MAAPTQFAFRTLKGIGIVDAAPVYEPLPGFTQPEGNLRCCSYSPDGRYFAYASAENVVVVNASTGDVVSTLNAANVFEVGFSPLGTYIITWQRFSKDENGDAVKNLKVWRVIGEGEGNVADEERDVVGRFVQLSQTGWNLQYTSDEKLCARVVTNEVQFYESHDLKTVWNKLRVEGVADFALPPGKSSSVAIFVPEKKGQPASVKVYTIPNFNSPISQKSFYKGDKVQLKWNNAGTALIVLAQTETDKSNQSYYGETTLYLLSASGDFDSRIDLDKEGPIHDVSWSPNSKEFGVVYGFMPAKSVIFNLRAKEVHSFALAPRNTILFSPHGRFVLVAGFGNLAGDVDIYDLEKNYQKVSAFKASNASLCEWSADGKHLVTATTSPRLRVDNGIRIWHLTGAVMYNQEITGTELWQVALRPQSIDQFPLGDPLTSIPAPHSSAAEYMGRVKTPSKPVGAYRPPGARGTSTPLSFMREDQGGAAYVRGAFGAATGASLFGAKSVPGADPAEKTVPGAAPAAEAAADENLSAAALKNKKKREAKKAKAAAEKAATLAPKDGEKSRAGSRSRSKDGHGGDRRGSVNDRRGSVNDRGSSRNRDRGNSDYRPLSRDRREGGRDGRADDRSRSRNRNDRDGKPRDQKPREPRDGGANGLKSPKKVEDKPTNGAPVAAARDKLPKLETPASRSSAAPAPDLTVTTPGGGNGVGSPTDKKLRSLTKKLRAIDELKMRRAGGEKLEATQIQKMSTEESVRKELTDLGWDGL